MNYTFEELINKIHTEHVIILQFFDKKGEGICYEVCYDESLCLYILTELFLYNGEVDEVGIEDNYSKSDLKHYLNILRKDYSMIVKLIA